MNYGTQINRLGWLDVSSRAKNRLITRYQYRILRYFSTLPLLAFLLRGGKVSFG